MERQSDRIARWILPTLGGLLVTAAYAFPIFLRGPLLFATDGDPGRHIRLGTYILESRHIPDVDLFSHTMLGEPFIPFEWLSEVIFAAFHMWAGLAGVALITALLFASTVWLVYLTMARAGIPSLLAVGFAFASMVLQAMHLHARPHMFTTLLVAAFAFLLLEARTVRRTKRLLLLPLLVVFWANIHGGFLVGFILVFLFVLDGWLEWWTRKEASGLVYAKRLTGVLGLCLAASLLTPAGFELWPHTTGYLGEEWLVAFTQEYRSPNFHSPLMKFFLAVFLLGTAVLALLRSGVDLLGLTIWILFTAFALHSGRNIPFFAVLALPWLATWVVHLAEQDAQPSSWATRFMDRMRGISRTEAKLAGWPIVAATLAALTLVALQPERRDVFRFSNEVFPVEAVEYLVNSEFQAPGPIFNEFRWGGYLLYRAWPEIPVFIDGQTDFYGEELTKEYVRIRGLAPDWKALLDKHNVRWALIPPDVALNQAFIQMTNWALIYSDSTAVVWVRADP